MAPPPPERPLARVRLYVNRKAAVFTPNLKHILRIPKLTRKAALAVGNSVQLPAMKGSGDCTDSLELEVVVEADGDDASDGEDGLARCARKQAAGTLEEYEEDSQQLPGDEGYQSEDDEDGLTTEDIDIMRNIEKLAKGKDVAVSDPEDESDDDDTYDGSSDGGDNDDGDFAPRFKAKGVGKSNGFKATGGKNCGQNVKKDANYTFCPLSH